MAVGGGRVGRLAAVAGWPVAVCMWSGGGAGAWPWPWPDGGGCLRGRMAGPCPNCAGPGLNQG